MYIKKIFVIQYLLNNAAGIHGVSTPAQEMVQHNKETIPAFTKTGNELSDFGSDRSKIAPIGQMIIKGWDKIENISNTIYRAFANQLDPDRKMKICKQPVNPKFDQDFQIGYIDEE